MMAAVISELARLHREATQVYRTYHNVDQAINKLILEDFEEAYLNALSDEVVGYASCMSLDLLTNLLTFYAMIAPTELTQNYERLNTPMILINRSRRSFSKPKMPEPLRSRVDNHMAMP
jgi:hypothetical protein